MVEPTDTAGEDQSALTDFHRVVIAGYRQGKAVIEIARRLGVSRSHVTKTACRLRLLGFNMPFNFVRPPGPRKAPPRFEASGITPGGGRISASADSQGFVDAHIAAMEADDAD